MSFFSRLWKNINKPVQLNCPRCLGKGHVDNDDIVRLKREGQWTTGKCAYCNGSGKVDETMLSKIPADAASLITNLSEEERNDIINNYNNEPEPVEKREDCPVSEPSRLWLEDAFLLLLDLFGKENIQQRKVLIPQYADFPFKFDGSGQPAYETMKIVSTQMEVSFESILFRIYDDGVGQISTGSPYGTSLYLESDKADKQAAGLYWGQTEEGKFEIWVERAQLTQPENLVATLAHEIAHIKLLGENRIPENDEFLTDLTTVVFGLGIFNANSAFQTFKEARAYGWQSQGYLSQMHWGYALALFASIRGEKSPQWIHHLVPSVRNDFLQGQQFIEDNPGLVFQ